MSQYKLVKGQNSGGQPMEAPPMSTAMPKVAPQQFSQGRNNTPQQQGEISAVQRSNQAYMPKPQPNTNWNMNSGNAGQRLAEQKAKARDAHLTSMGKGQYSRQAQAYASNQRKPKAMTRARGLN